jgi:hypothetical protein
MKVSPSPNTFCSAVRPSRLDAETRFALTLRLRSMVGSVAQEKWGLLVFPAHLSYGSRQERVRRSAYPVSYVASLELPARGRSHSFPQARAG